MDSSTNSSSSRLKPRYTSSGISSTINTTSSSSGSSFHIHNNNNHHHSFSQTSSSINNKKSSSIDQFFQKSSKQEYVHDDDDDDDDNMSFMSKTIQLLWKKKRKRKKSSSKYKHYTNASPETINKFVKIANALLLMVCVSWMTHFYDQHYSLQKTLEGSTAFDMYTSTDGGMFLQPNMNNSTSSSTQGDEQTTAYLNRRARHRMKQRLKRIKDAEVIVPRLATKPSHRIQPNPSLQIPQNIDKMFQDITTPRQSTDIPVFWHILKSGGTSMKDLFGECMAKVEAAEAGIMNGHINDTVIEKVSFGSNIEYINVDATTAGGISRAINMNLVQSDLVDIIITPLLHESSQLFNNTYNRKGRLFGLFRHPVERAVSLFHYLKKATWEPTFSERLRKIKSVEDYAISEFAEDNWMVRFLTNKMTTMVTRDDLEIAKEILRRKFIVGILLDTRGSVERYLHYFGWNYNDLTPEQQKCMNKKLSVGSNKNKHDIVEEGTMGWRILRANNLLDLELYDYVLQLYEEQGQMFGIPKV